MVDAKATPIKNKLTLMIIALLRRGTSQKTGSPKGFFTGNIDRNKLNMPIGKERRARKRLTRSAAIIQISCPASIISPKSGESRADNSFISRIRLSIWVFIRRCGANHKTRSNPIGNSNNVRCLVMESNPVLIDLRTLGDSGRAIRFMFIDVLFYHTTHLQSPLKMAASVV